MLPWTGTTGACAGGLQVDGSPLVHGMGQRCKACGPRLCQGGCCLGLAPLMHAQGTAR